MRVVLHVGLPKTGTTAIQRTLAANRPVLAAQGILYPASLGRVYHWKLAALALQDPLAPWAGATARTDGLEGGPDAILHALQDEIAQVRPNILLISSEHLTSRLQFPTDYENLRTLLAAIDAQTEALIYLRPIADYAAASYTESVKNGRHTPFHVSDVLQNPDRYDYNRVIRRWEDTLHSVTIRVFDRRRFPDGNVINDFLDALGIHGITPSTDAENISPDAVGIEVFRRLNAVNVARRGPLLRRAILSDIVSLNAGPKFGLSKSDAATINQCYARGIEALHSRYDNGIDWKSLTCDSEEVTVTEVDVIDRLLALIQRLAFKELPPGKTPK